jgi:hypothetical protein
MHVLCTVNTTQLVILIVLQVTIQVCQGLLTNPVLPCCCALLLLCCSTGQAALILLPCAQVVLQAMAQGLQVAAATGIVVLVRCAGALCWCDVLVRCAGALCWRAVLVRCAGVLCWCDVLVRCAGVEQKKLGSFAEHLVHGLL